MKARIFSAIFLAAALFAAIPAKAGQLVNVYVGYLNNLSPFNPADVPTPFDPDATTTLISSGDSTTSHDTGVIRFENIGSVSASIDPGLVVTLQGGTFQIWDGSLPFILAPGQNLVLAETANFNFDSSDFGLGIDPVVSGVISGQAFSFVDTTRVLLGHEEGVNGPETTPYHRLGTVHVPVPATLPLLLAGALGLGFARRRK